MPTMPNTLLWLSRALALAMALFIGVFALDAFSEGPSFWAALPHFLRHLLPTWILLAAIAVAWRRPWIGGLAFLSLAGWYATRVRRLDWILVIAGPLVLVATLYFLSWWWPRRWGRAA
jgi:hypothetical protein